MDVGRCVCVLGGGATQYQLWSNDLVGVAGVRWCEFSSNAASVVARGCGYDCDMAGAVSSDRMEGGMTVWFGAVDKNGGPLSSEFVKRLSSDDVRIILEVDEAGQLWMRSARMLNLEVRRECTVRSVGMFAFEHSMELVYNPSAFTSGAKDVRQGQLLQAWFSMSMDMNEVKRPDISSLKAMEG